MEMAAQLATPTILLRTSVSTLPLPAQLDRPLTPTASVSQEANAHLTLPSLMEFASPLTLSAQLDRLRTLRDSVFQVTSASHHTPGVMLSKSVSTLLLNAQLDRPSMPMESVCLTQFARQATLL